MSESAKIVLPLPSKYLLPNCAPFSKGGAARKAMIAAQYRKKAKAIAESLGIESGPWQRVEVAYRYFHKVRRDRDDDNYISALKPARDGIVQAGIVVDDSSEHWRITGCEFGIDRKYPRVEIELTRIA